MDDGESTAGDVHAMIPSHMSMLVGSVGTRIRVMLELVALYRSIQCVVPCVTRKATMFPEVTNSGCTRTPGL